MSGATGSGADLARIEAMAQEAAEGHGLRLYEVRMIAQRGRSVLRIMVDRPGGNVPGQGVTVEQCADLSLELGQLFDAQETIPYAYDLEVSSPGVERPLEQARHFEWAVGEQVKLVMREGYGGPTELEGVLESFQGEVLALRLPPKLKAKKGQRLNIPPREEWERVEIHRSDVRKARTSYPFAT